MILHKKTLLTVSFLTIVALFSCLYAYDQGKNLTTEDILQLFKEEGIHFKLSTSAFQLLQNKEPTVYEWEKEELIIYEFENSYIREQAYSELVLELRTKKKIEILEVSNLLILYSPNGEKSMMIPSVISLLINDKWEL
ncbi:hypothetical protein WAK64_06545 [Bacillus spongiae]|uniref:Lipoprotein n=1 Tax=Bacillus spongiae TaxID=2683610 RepID=A0ABU8HBQ7_9BACI